MNRKKKPYFWRFCFVLLLCFGSVAGFSQERTAVKGRVMDLASSRPLENACIHNLSAGTMAFCNQNGDFAILAKRTDTLIVSQVGYNMEVLMLNDSLIASKERLSIWMVVRAFMLRGVTIYAMKPYPLFIKDITKETPTKKIDVPGIEITQEERANYDPNNGNLLRGTPLASPITYLYDRFSRRAKMDRMYADLVQNQSEAIRLPKKYNSEIVQRLTKLEGEKLEEFMVYCSFTYYALVTSTDQEIEQMIVAKFIQYKKENGDNR
jgi:hypothetical protein